MRAVEAGSEEAAIRQGMRIGDIPFGTIFLLELVSDRGALPPEFAEGLEVRLGRQAGGGVWLLRPGERTVAALLRPRDAHRIRTLRQLVESAWPKLAVIVKRPEDETLVVRVHEFTYRQPWPSGESLRIGLPPALLKPLARLCGKQQLTLEEGVDILRGEFLLEPVAEGEPTRLFLAVGAAAADQRFRLHGPNLTVDVRQDERHRVLVLSVGGATAPDGRLSLTEIDDVAFVPEGEVEVLSAVSRAMLARLFSGTERYLRLWNQYNELDRQRLDDEAVKIGYFRYSSWQEISGDDFGFRFRLVDDDDDEDRKANLSALRDATGKAAVLLEAAVVPPVFLIEGEDEEEPQSRPRRKQRVMIGQCRAQDIDPTGRWIELRTFDDEASDNPPSHGYLYLSQAGSRIAMERREIAQAGIRSGACPMPQLGMILENQALPALQETERQESHVSPLVRALFDKGPTPFQEQAVNIAINTPDIAVIQGPPGTGKTEVISAIVKRLEELADPGENPAGLFLITSFQHVAVENVAARIQPFGLPPLKVGRSKAARGESPQAAPTVEWLEKTVAYVRGQEAYSSNAAAVETLRAAQLQLQSYALGHHRLDETADMLDRIIIATSDLVPADIQERGRLVAQKLRAVHRDQLRGPSPEEDAAYRAAYGLRYQRVPFLDDGPLVAAKVLVALEKLPKTGDAVDGICSTQDLSLLDSIRKMDRNGPTSVPTADDFKAFAALRERLLLRLTPERRPLSVRAAPREDVGIVLSDIVKAVRDRVYASGAGVPLILNDYQLELQQSSWRLEGALKRYTAAIAETCQGSARSLRASLQANLNARGYETVIIDEAARANPLDLLIPMAQARRRIILVGDHRQLPHSLEPELEEDVKATFDEEEQEALQMSLFERLFNDLKRRESEDGEPCRAVTLETQFRMPRLLGDFISAQFYNRELNSPDTSHFRHCLQRYSRDGIEYVAAWIDVPARGGRNHNREIRGATTRSISRRVEAEAVHFAIKDILDEKPDASIGVISFYADQVSLLQDLLEPLCQEQRRRDRRPIEVGSVDAFQGKQYSVVFLSMTRCNALEFKDLPVDMEPRAARLEMERRMRSRYGHLVLANRMCVALSRQRNLMIVVGDRGMLTYSEAATAIGPLKAFDELCTQKGMHFEWSDRDLRLVSVGTDPTA
jgi:hypothetical protein